MANVIFKPFMEVRDAIEKRFGIEEIPYYVCVGIDENSPIRSISKRTISYYNKPIDEFIKYHKLFTSALRDGYVIRFNWKGEKRSCIFSRSNGKLNIAHFTDTDNYTWLSIGYDENKGRCFVFCNYNIDVDGSYGYAAKCMTEVEVFNMSSIF